MHYFFAIAFLFGGLAMVSGVRLSKKIAIFDNFPEFVGRTFHIIVSMVFVASILVIYFAWTFIAPPPSVNSGIHCMELSV